MISAQLDALQEAEADIDSGIQKNEAANYDRFKAAMGDFKQDVEKIASTSNKSPTDSDTPSYAHALTRSLGEFKAELILENEAINKQMKASVDRSSKIMEDQLGQKDQDCRSSIRGAFRT